ncbi:hypothetical protein Taro_018462 [Colocasia esculenta]|uniref:RRM domain-containing protein n=1 Tax=Colocasia esculenta TaxID=4460 RepID=A0A843UWB9_COLES|nr:hypothetical protein [Colocasia esculenta]
MRRYSPPYYSPPRRGYGGGRGRSPPRRGYGGYGGRREQSHRSLLVRNIPMNCSEPRGFAFVEYINPYDATEAQHHMNRRLLGGREITVVAAAETRKRPEQMRRRHSRSVSRSRSPYRPSNSRVRHGSRSYSPEPRRRDDRSVSPKGRQSRSTRSPRDYPHGSDDDRGRDSYSGGYADAEHDKTENGYSKKVEYDAGESRPQRRSPGRTSRSLSGSRSRSRSAHSSPRHSR